MKMDVDRLTKEIEKVAEIYKKAAQSIIELWGAVWKYVEKMNEFEKALRWAERENRPLAERFKRAKKKRVKKKYMKRILEWYRTEIL